MSLRDAIDAAHARICAAPPPMPGWPRAGRAVPAANIVAALKRHGWPTVTVEAAVPNPDPTRRGNRTPPQPVLCVPAAWLAVLAEGLGWDWAKACRYEIPDEE